MGSFVGHLSHTGQRPDLGVGVKRPPHGGGPGAARAASGTGRNVATFVALALNMAMSLAVAATGAASALAADVSEKTITGYATDFLYGQEEVADCKLTEKNVDEAESVLVFFNGSSSYFELEHGPLEHGDQTEFELRLVGCEDQRTAMLSDQSASKLLSLLDHSSAGYMVGFADYLKNVSAKTAAHDWRQSSLFSNCFCNVVIASDFEQLHAENF